MEWVGNPHRKDGSIVIHNLDYTDNGTFTCDVKNPPDIVGKSSQVTLYVFEKGTGATDPGTGTGPGPAGAGLTGAPAVPLPPPQCPPATAWCWAPSSPGPCCWWPPWWPWAISSATAGCGDRPRCSGG